MEIKKYIIDNYKQNIEIVDGIESFCYQNCQRILLQMQGLDNPELYLNASLSFGYDRKRETVVTRNNVRSLLPQYLDCVKRIEYFEEVSAKDIYEKNIEYIYKNKMPIIVGVDTYYLEYASNYMKNHARHTLVLCGFNQQEEKVQVIDWYPPWYYKGEISLEAFLNARSSKNDADGTLYSGNPIRNNWAKIDNLPRKTANELLIWLLEETLKEQKDNENDADIVYGIRAIKEFSEFIERTTDKEEMQQTYKRLNVITKRYNFFKMYMSHFDDMQIVKKIILNLDYEIEEWDKVGMLLLKASMVISDRIKEKINIRLNNIMTSENELKDNIVMLYKLLLSEVERNG